MSARIFAQRLDRARPLWEAWFLEGIKGGRWAILSKVHHCMVDGIGGADLMAALFEAGPGDSAARAGCPGNRGRGPPPPRCSPAACSTRSPGRCSSSPTCPGCLLRRLPSPGELLHFGRGLTGSARRLTVPSASSLNGSIGPHRRWTWTTASLTQVKKIRRALNVTVNDVVLAVITTGFRDLLEARGELADGLVVRTLVPVSLRGENEHQPVSNQVSAVLANLPVSEPDPVRRLELLHEQMADLKRSRQAVGAELLTEMLGFAAPALLALGSRAAFRMPQPLVQTVTTNVPGPRFPLFILGRQLSELYPYVPIGDNVRIGIAVFSYLDTFSFGITADYRAVPESDLDILTAGIRQRAGRAARPRQAATAKGDLSQT